jgi:hypothetical protein
MRRSGIAIASPGWAYRPLAPAYLIVLLVGLTAYLIGPRQVSIEPAKISRAASPERRGTGAAEARACAGTSLRYRGTKPDARSRRAASSVRVTVTSPTPSRSVTPSTSSRAIARRETFRRNEIPAARRNWLGHPARSASATLTSSSAMSIRPRGRGRRPDWSAPSRRPMRSDRRSARSPRSVRPRGAHPRRSAKRCAARPSAVHERSHYPVVRGG